MTIKHRARRAAVAIGLATIVPLGLMAAAPAAHASSGSYDGKVVASTSLNVRAAPTSAAPKVGSLARGAKVKIQCKVFGPSVGGNDLWYKLSSGKWVTARYVSNVGAAPHFCGKGKTYVGKVLPSTLNVRTGPHTSNAKTSSAPRGIELVLVCKVDSKKVDGNPRWYQLVGDGGGQWVAARYVSNVGAAPPYC
ncbi:SH3 domain-containing protein [Phytoactinopolyspora limicola]|uniref:SH3 domain-containing protein n=1 Tax=Phytoactinopolyspora limicola TaxID=2715536 RepID=UPI0014091848|nr:SH3 domain-containing protein [Phytoactinopolyspora limicola]